MKGKEFIYAYFQFGRYFVRFRINDQEMPVGNIRPPYQVVVHRDDMQIYACMSDNVTLDIAYYILMQALNIDHP